MSIAQKLSWEIQALNDRGDASLRQYLAAEIAYGVALQIGDQPELFSAVMSSIISQVHEAEMQRLLRLYTGRGLK